MTLAAYTAATGAGYPPYFNATRDGDDVVVTVRAPAVPASADVPYPHEGVSARMRIPVDEFRRMLAEMSSTL